MAGAALTERPVSGACSWRESWHQPADAISRHRVAAGRRAHSIDGEPGMGYLLRPGFMLPPLMFSKEETRLSCWSSRWVRRSRRHRAGGSARVICSPRPARATPTCAMNCDSSALLVGPVRRLRAGDAELPEDPPRHRRSASRDALPTPTWARGRPSGSTVGRSVLDASSDRVRVRLPPGAAATRLDGISAPGPNRRPGRVEGFRPLRVRARSLLKEWRARPAGLARLPESYCHFLAVACKHARRTSKPEERYCAEAPQLLHPLRRPPGKERRVLPRIAGPRAGRASPTFAMSPSTQASCSDSGPVIRRRARGQRARAAAMKCAFGRRQGARKISYIRGLEQTRAANRAGTRLSWISADLRGAGSGPALALRAFAVER